MRICWTVTRLLVPHSGSCDDYNQLKTQPGISMPKLWLATWPILFVPVQLSVSHAQLLPRYLNAPPVHPTLLTPWQTSRRCLASAAIAPSCLASRSLSGTSAQRPLEFNQCIEPPRACLLQLRFQGSPAHISYSIWYFASSDLRHNHYTQTPEAIRSASWPPMEVNSGQGIQINTWFWSIRKTWNTSTDRRSHRERNKPD